MRFLSIRRFLPNPLKRRIKNLLRNISDSIHYYLISEKLINCSCHRSKKPSYIVFVCKGNVCRSAFAEQRLKRLLPLSNVKIDSCGLDVDQGSFPPEESVAVASEFSCNLAKRQAKSLNDCSIDKADLILLMEYWQYRRLVNLYPHKRSEMILLRTLSPFPYSLLCNIDDPYGWGIKEFRQSFRLIDKSLKRLANWL